MRILVTGGSGFIGSAFIRKMMKNADISILNLDKLTYAANQNALYEVAENPNYQFIKGDICDTEIVNNCLNEFKPEAIVHFAAESHVDNSIDDASAFLKTNIMGTHTLLAEGLKFWQTNGSPETFKFIHVSTDEVYGSLTANDAPFTTATPYAPNSPYSASKAASDHVARSWNQTYQFPVLITHCSNNFGAWQNKEKLIPNTITKALNNQDIPVYGSGENIRDWIYVDDHVDGIATILKTGTIGQTYNMGGDNEVSNINLVQTICKSLDQLRPNENGKSYADQIKFVTDRKGHDFRYAIDNGEIKNALGWAPHNNFDDALKQTIQWYLKEAS